MPQIVLTVPPEVIRLLTDIKSSLQRVEAELRDVARRLEWARPAAGAERPSLRVVGPAPDVRDDLREMAAERPSTRAQADPPKRGPYRSTHIPAGPVAAKKMEALLVRTNLSGVKLAEKLGTHQTTVSMVKRGRLGISRRLHEAMAKLEAQR